MPVDGTELVTELLLDDRPGDVRCAAATTADPRAQHSGRCVEPQAGERHAAIVGERGYRRPLLGPRKGRVGDDRIAGSKLIAVRARIAR